MPWLFLSSAFAEDELVADFEGPDFGTWTATGTAFGNAPARGALFDQAPVGGFRGQGFANSFHGGDQPTGTLTSPEFTVSKRYLNFLIGGGEEVGKTCVNVLMGGRAVHSATGREDEFLNMATFDLEEFVGKAARIEIVDAHSGGWGHINADHFVLSDTAATPPYRQIPADPGPIYREAFRPQFHFTARTNWLNDPNGLVFLDGEYHLFFQHNPQGTGWGNMTWGHAVSSNLVQWTQLDHALLPDRMGTMFSGSVIVDRHNTGGFQSGTNLPLVAFYTAAGGTSDESKGQPFTQCLAYSNDRGRTWTKYAGNPVVPNLGVGDRDPKVFWHAPTKRWVMPLYVGVRDPQRPAGSLGENQTRPELRILTSPDLKAWTQTGVFSEELYECPGLVELPVDGDSGNTRWVLWGADMRYWICRFDGRTLVKESGPHSGDRGANFYAAQAYDDLPDRRTVLVGWMRGGKYPGMPFNQQMGFPLELTLQTTPDGLRLVSWPVRELSRLFTSVLREDFPRPVPAGRHPIKATNPELLDVELEFQPGTATSVTLELRGQRLVWEAKSRELVAFGRRLPLPPAVKPMGRRTEFAAPWGPDFEPWDGSVRLRVLLDRTSLELFGNGGVLAASFCFVPHTDPSAALIVEGGELLRARITVRELKPARGE